MLADINNGFPSKIHGVELYRKEELTLYSPTPLKLDTVANPGGLHL